MRRAALAAPAPYRTIRSERKHPPVGAAVHGWGPAGMFGARVGLSRPEALTLEKVMRPKLPALFVGSVDACIVLVGCGFNLLL